MLGMLVGVLRRVIGGGEGSTLCEPPLYIREKLPYKAYTRGLTVICSGHFTYHQVVRLGIL